jgi:hypothetical protein
MTRRRDPDTLIHQFLLEGSERLPDPIYDEVRATIDRTRQRVVIGPWRTTLDMNKLLAYGLGAAAVVAVLFIGIQLFGPPAQGGVGAGPSPAPSSTSAPTADSLSPAPWTGLPEGSFVVTTEDDAVQVTVQIAAPNWQALRDFDAVHKDDDGLDPPTSVGAALLAWSWPAGTGIDVYGDACKWQTTVPESGASTPGEITAALEAQESTDATAPADVTVGGFTGKAITLEVPMSFDLPGASREEKFADCDEAALAFYGVDGESGHARNAQGAGQIDELWILDVNGSIVILDLAYSPATPEGLVEELRTLAATATFE